VLSLSLLSLSLSLSLSRSFFLPLPRSLSLTHTHRRNSFRCACLATFVVCGLTKKCACFGHLGLHHVAQKVRFTKHILQRPNDDSAVMLSSCQTTETVTSVVVIHSLTRLVPQSASVLQWQTFTLLKLDMQLTSKVGRCCALTITEEQGREIGAVERGYEGMGEWLV
jgi:hypothetical protein